MQAMANIALRAGRRGAQILLRAMDRLDELKVEEKAPDDFVSNIDREAERVIVDALLKTYPDHAILAEEGSAAGANEGAEFTWIIDPLDGTLNYLQGIPHYAVSIAVRRGRQLEHGVIIDPVRNEEWVASRGSGAQLNGKRIRVSQTKRLSEAVLATGLPAGAKPQAATYLDDLAQFTPQCRSLRRLGSAALDLAYTAAGRVDGFWEMGLAPWDIAAGVLIVKEAGGFVGDLEGGEHYFDSGDIVAANPKCFKLMVAKLRQARATGYTAQASNRRLESER